MHMPIHSDVWHQHQTPHANLRPTLLALRKYLILLSYVKTIHHSSHSAQGKIGNKWELCLKLLSHAFSNSNINEHFTLVNSFFIKYEVDSSLLNLWPHHHLPMDEVIPFTLKWGIIPLIKHSFYERNPHL